MKAMSVVPVAALALSACVAPGKPADTPHSPVEAKCDLGGLSDLVGKPATQDLAADALKRTGARSIRWKAPGMAMTMDYRADRLNIAIDANNLVTGFDCG